MFLLLSFILVKVQYEKTYARTRLYKTLILKMRIFFSQSQKRVYMIINATKRRGGKTCVIEPPLPKVLTIIGQIHLEEI